MKKSTGFLTLLLIIAIICGLGYIMLYGVDDRDSGATKNTKLGLDLAGGVSITYEVVGDEKPSDADIADTKEKLRHRIDKFSTESDIYVEGNDKDRIVIEIPGVSDAEGILKELGSPGVLYFVRPLDTAGNMNYAYMYTALQTPVLEDDEAGICFAKAEDGKYYQYDPVVNDFRIDPNGYKLPFKGDVNKGQPKHCLTKTLEELEADGSLILSGTDVASAQAKGYTNEYNQSQYIVSLSFTDEGAKIFANETALAANRDGLPGTIAIYYDGELISVPNVTEAITDGSCQISGNFSHDEAERLATNIRIGGLKVELKELRSNVVGAQLGGEAIHTSLKAGVIGVAIVMLFMIVVYFVPGFASAIALLIYTMLVMVCIGFLNITMTLPGIAGVILSIGMAVDANVIIFARIREEIAAGSNVENAITAGFAKALSAIIDGNITTLIAALVLIMMGSGSIKGFAYTLALGIIISMFTALVITKLILKALYAVGFKNARWYGKGKEVKNINFLGKKKLYFGISIAVIVIGIGMMIFNGSNGKGALNFGLEFKGGTATTVDFGKDLERAEIDGQVVADIQSVLGNERVQWTKVNDTTQVIFKTRDFEDEERGKISAMFLEKYGVAEENIQVETISSTISNEMQRQAIIAVLVATLCMLIYIWIRFSDFRFGTSAVVALIHDVAVVLTFYAIIRISVGNTFIACMLTIVGYSINATIVVFDRIRENLKKIAKKETLEDVVNKSITQTLSRSIFTSFTTFIMVAVLYILGVTAIREFALPLMIGIVSGTYSSICLTGSLWWVLRNKFPQDDND